jgi:hypothetical protein
MLYFSFTNIHACAQMYNLHALTELAPVAHPVLNHHIAAVLPPLLALAGKAPAPCRAAPAAAANGDAAAANGTEKCVCVFDV